MSYNKSSLNASRGLLLENALDAVVGIDQGSIIIDWNIQATKTFGWSKKEAIGQCLSEMIIPQEFRKPHHEGIKRFLETGLGRILNNRIELMAIHKSGKSFPIELTVTAIQEDDGYLFYAFVRDITERKSIEEVSENARLKAEENEEKMKIIMDSSPAFMGYLDKNMYYRLVNRKYEETFGISSEEVVGKHARSIIGEAAFNKSSKHYELALKGKRSQSENIITDKNGLKHCTDVQYIPFIQDGQVEGMIIVAVDITDQKNDEKDQKLLAELSSLYATNVSEEQLITKTTQLLAHRLDVSRCWIAEASEDSTTSTVVRDYSNGLPSLKGTYDLNVFGPEMVSNWRQGRIVTLTDVSKDSRTRDHASEHLKLGICSFMSVPLHRDGRLKALLDISTEHIREWTLQEVEIARAVGETLWSTLENNRLVVELKNAIRSRDEFISICSHELKTPITSMKLQFQLAEKQLAKNDPRAFSMEAVAKRVSISTKQLDRMTKLIDDMLDVSRISSGKLQLDLEPVNLRVIIAEVIERFEEQMTVLNIHVSFNLDEHSEIVLGDRYRLEQVFTNMLTNAIKYGAGKPIEVKLCHNETHAQVYFKDLGIGIEQSNLDRIFQRYERAISSTNISGLGLGLYITKQIVEGHEGLISVKSVRGEGSTFMIEIPLLNQES